MLKNRVFLYTSLAVFTLLLAACGGNGTTPDESFALTVALSGDGSGVIESDDGLINCPGDCDETYKAGKVVTVTATPSQGSTFVGWSGGACEDPAQASCTLTVDEEVNITASFAQVTNPDPDPVTIIIPMLPCETIAGCNDAEEFTSEADEPFDEGDVDVSSSDLEFNYEAEDRNVEKLVGVRFVPTLEQIPADAVISAAYIEFTPKVASSEDSVTLTIKAQTDDPAEFIPSDENLSARSKTDNGVDWPVAPWLADTVSAATQTPDLKSLLDDIEWQAGTAVAFFFEGDGSTVTRSAVSSDPVDASGNLNPAGPRLVVTYTLPSGS